MKKKLIIIVAVIIAVLVCAAVFMRPDTADAPVEGDAVTVNLEPETTKEPLFSPSFDKTVKVTLPIEFVDEEYRNNLEAFAESNGYYSIEKKGDTHVKIEMREFSYNLILSSIGMETIGGIGSAMDSGDYPYFTDLAKYNDDFSEVIIAVNKGEYDKAENKDSLFSHIALYCLYYQDYDNDSKGKCEITVCEEGTNILIETRELTKENLV